RVFHGGAKSRLHAPGSSGSAAVGGERGTPGGSRPSPIHVWWRAARGGWSVSGRYRASDSVTTTRTHRTGQVAGDLEGLHGHTARAKWQATSKVVRAGTAVRVRGYMISRRPTKVGGVKRATEQPAPPRAFQRVA